MSASFLLFSLHKDINKVCKRDIDCVLDCGNDIYKQVYAKVQKELLSVDELPGYISEKGTRYKLNLGPLKYGSIHQFNTFTLNMSQTFALYSEMYIVCGGSCISIKCVEGKYFLFDSHNRNKFGFQQSNGVACLIKFVNFHELCLHIQKLYCHVEQGDYEIWPSRISMCTESSNVTDKTFCHMNFKIFHVYSIGDKVEHGQKRKVTHDMLHGNVESSNCERSSKRSKSTIQKSCDHVLEQCAYVRESYPDSEFAVFSKTGELLTVNNEPVKRCQSETEKENSESTVNIIRLKLSRDKSKWTIKQGKKDKSLQDFEYKVRVLIQKYMSRYKKMNTFFVTLEMKNGKWTSKMEKEKVSIKTSKVIRPQNDDNLKDCNDNIDIEKSSSSSANEKSRKSQAIKLRKRCKKTKRLSRDKSSRRFKRNKCPKTKPITGNKEDVTYSNDTMSTSDTIPYNIETDNIHIEQDMVNIETFSQSSISLSNCTGEMPNSFQKSSNSCNVQKDNSEDSDKSSMYGEDFVHSFENENLSTDNISNVESYNNSNEYIPMNSKSKIEKLNKAIEFECTCCTKLCFTEQGRIIPVTRRTAYLPLICTENIIHNWFVCQTCENSLKTNKTPKISKKNGIEWPSKIDDLDITPEEERLIALRIPFMQIKILPSGAQKQLKGNIINVPTDVAATVNLLPRYLNENGVVTVRLKRKLQYRGVYRQANVRPYVVLKALKWLISNSLYYQTSNINIDTEWLQKTLNEIENVNVMRDSENESESETENCNSDNDKSNNDIESDKTALENNEEANDNESDSFSEIDVGNHTIQYNSLIEREEDPLYYDIAPGQGRRPIHFFYDKYMEEMCFPIMYGGQTIPSIFGTNISLVKRVRWQLVSADRRAASNAEMIFLNYKKYQMDYVYSKVNFSIRCVKNNTKYTVEDVMNDTECRNIVRLDKGYYFFKQLRNSPQYLQEKKRELLATVRQNGIPTFFVSLSCADMKWVPLLQCLGELVDRKTYTKEEIESMSFFEKTRLINSDPVTTARYFDRRFQFFLTHILYKPPFPLGRVCNHFYRVEFQHRGSPHIHMLLYCADVPRYKKYKKNEELIRYADKYISCSLTVPDHMKPCLPYQIHKHSKTCRKMGKAICRFGFPLPPFNETIILRKNLNRTKEQIQKYKEIQKYLDSDHVSEVTTLEDLLNYFELSYQDYLLVIRSSLVSDKLFLKRKPYEGRVNMYMKNLLHIWEANMDCQLCLNAYSVINYIVNYINKENRGLSLNLDKVAKECESKKSNIRDTIKALGNVFINTTEISVQECIYVLMGLPLTFFSVDIVHVPTFIPEKRTKIVKSQRDLMKEDRTSSNIFKDDKFQKYMDRPSHFNSWCLADFVTKVTVTERTSYSLRREKTGFYIMNNGTEVVNSKTHKYKILGQKVLSYVCPSRRRDKQRYYRIQLLLFHPWRTEITFESISTTFETYFKGLSTKERQNILQNIEFYNKEKIDDLEKMYDEMIRDGNNVTVASEIDHLNAQDRSEGSYCLTEGDFFQPDLSVNDLSRSDLTYEGHILRDSNILINSLWPTDELYRNVLSLNQGQRQIFDHVMKHVIISTEPCNIFITGGAGTGKTLLLHTLYQSLSRHFNLQANANADASSVLCLASTGKAAYLIKGNTVHTGLGIKSRRFNRKAKKVGPDELNTLRFKLQHLQCVMIDEISMVGSKLFREVDRRLQQIFGNYLPFGGRHILCFGDLYQLPPVKDKWIFEETAKGLQVFTPNSWTDFFYMHELTETMRQKDGENFADVLNRMRSGTNTVEDIKLLKSRQISEHLSSTMVDVMHIYSTNKAVKAFNQICYDKCTGEKYKVISVDRSIEKMSEIDKENVEKAIAEDEVPCSLDRDLYLAIGLLYELTFNLNVEDGLVNGAAGYLKVVQYSDMSDRPIALWFEFEEERIGSIQRKIYLKYRTSNILENWTPIFAHTMDFDIEGVSTTIQRTQFPVKQSTARTIHKAQGSTVPEIVVNLENHTFRNGCYVACSRVRELEDLFLVHFNKKQICTDKSVDSEMERLRLERPVILNSNFVRDYGYSFALYYNNVQSMVKHVYQVNHDIIVAQCNILLFNETHVLNTDNEDMYTIDGYKQITLNTIRNESGRRKFRGLACYYHDYLQAKVKHSWQCDKYEFMSLEIKSPTSNIQVGLFYICPKAILCDIWDMFQDLMESIDIKENVLIFGDLNKNCKNIENTGIIDAIETLTGLKEKLPGTSTKSNTKIDICLSNLNIDLITHYISWSHHFAITSQML